ncbi:helix-turn-helix domain-containing protein [Exiguobacterium aurantiacum]|uniref:helix-turn-helix domain-containing protein n=1 Tax=Exiguobacterium aurantiacum TaxID=33987 RepID=UPI00384DD77E
MGKPMTPSSCIMKIATTHIQLEEITHLTTTERLKIETYLELVVSIRSIARRLVRQPMTVSKEIEDVLSDVPRAKQPIFSFVDNSGPHSGLDGPGKEFSGHERVRKILSVKMYFT